MLSDHLYVGAIWRQVKDGRYIKIIFYNPNDIGPWWTYCDAGGIPEPNEEHYCDALDFVLWKRFVPVTN